MMEYFQYLALFGFFGMGVYLIYDALKFHLYSEEITGVITQIEEYCENGEFEIFYRYLIFVEFETIDGKQISGRIVKDSLWFNMWVGNKIQIFYLTNDPHKFEFSIPSKWLGILFGLASIIFGGYLFLNCDNF